MAGQGTVLAEMGGGWLQCQDEQGMYYYNEFTEQSTEVWPPPAMGAMPAAQVGYAPTMAPQQYMQPAQQYVQSAPMQFMQQPAPQMQFAAQPATMQAAQPMMMPPQSMMQQPMQMQPQMMMPQAQPMMQQPLPQMNLASVPSMVVMPSAGMPGMPGMPVPQNNFPQAASMIAVPSMGQPIPSGSSKKVDPEADLASSVVTRDLTNAAKSAVAVKSKKATKKKKSSAWSCC